MKHVWKCDFCCETNIDKESIRIHESKCTFNPKMRSCYSCENFEDIYDCHGCKKDLDYWEFSEEGNCDGWETDDKKLLRKLKLQSLYENT